MGLAIDGSGNIYVADYGNHCIRKITPGGIVTTFAGITTVSGQINASTRTAALFKNPTALTIDGSGNMYIADNGNNSIRKITSAGVVSTFAGSLSSASGFTDATGSSALFDAPFGIAVDGSGNVYVSEKGNHTIRKITSGAVVTTLAGNGTSGNVDGTTTAARFNAPAGITLDGSGNILVTDFGNNILRQVTTAGVVTTLSPVGASSYGVSNSTYDDNGNLLFFVQDNYIKTGTGATAGRLSYYGSLVSDIGNEVSIVPVPGSCRDFYIIYSRMASVFTTDLLYTQVQVSGTGEVSIVFDGLLIDGGAGGTWNCIAVSTIQTGNVRHLYSLSNGYLKKFIISSSGIGSGSIVLSSGGDAYELELSPNSQSLAWADRVSGSLHIVTLPSTEVTYTLSSTDNYGLEFSSNSQYLYLSTSSGISKFNMSTHAFTGVTGTGSFANSQIELAGDGYIYGINGSGTPAGLLSRLNTTTDVTTAAVLANPILSNMSTAPTSGLYRLPDQIDGENYSYFFGVGKPNTLFTINSSTTSPTVAVNTFTCSTISLGSLANAATAYSITVKSSDASGNIIAGYSYPTGLITSTPAATIDIKALNSNYLATNPGYYLIQYYAQNTCVSSTYSGLIQNSTISTASADFRLLDGAGNSFVPTNTLPGTNVSAYGVGINGSYSTGYIATYQIKVDKVDCSTPATILTANVVNTAATPVSGGNPANILGVSLNSKSSPFGYFSNIANAGCYNITYTVTNACGSSSQTGLFNSDPAVWRLRATSSNIVEGKIYPNPTNGLTTIKFNLAQESIVKLTLKSMQGNSSFTILNAEHATAGANELLFDTSALQAGIYLYQLSDENNTIQTGKLVLTK